MWQEWSACPHTGSSGLSHRNRKCDSPAPSPYGDYCTGDPVQYRQCNDSQSVDKHGGKIQLVSSTDSVTIPSMLPNMEVKYNWLAVQVV